MSSSVGHAVSQTANLRGFTSSFQDVNESLNFLAQVYESLFPLVCVCASTVDQSNPPLSVSRQRPDGSSKPEKEADVINFCVHRSVHYAACVICRYPSFVCVRVCSWRSVQAYQDKSITLPQSSQGGALAWLVCTRQLFVCKLSLKLFKVDKSTRPRGR